MNTGMSWPSSSADERLIGVLGSFDDEESPIVEENNLRYSRSVNDVFLEEPEAVALAQYDDFHTIDWVRDRQRDLRRFRLMRKRKRGNFWDRLKQANDAWAGWLVVFFVGLAAGLSAGIIDIGASWMSDLKLGVCPENFWFNQEACCWSDDSSFGEVGCRQWKSWSELLTGKNTGAAAYVLNYFLYIAIALVFSFLAVILVRWFAPYACGSGIPEVPRLICLDHVYLIV